MLYEELRNRYQLEKDQLPLHANELLDYIQKSYIQREISIVEYKKFYSILHKRNAEKPHSYMIKQTRTLPNINIPG